ncbi:hypothetical protein LEP1GSC133_1467 [Leptospira borgpetersenii serovar Pomona str. 200901868]|uniref:Uncharacterized protein n=1 Tax=Leptospira borgpetersenii serovar Pomona str. 200901868 TaxID=1192866 RepID=M6WHC6_LEPBO|nr:hypothetical protein LEP1GSC133_1467 [Leptospira borgpetersenii serovar Pomona str. 200901868]
MIFIAAVKGRCSDSYVDSFLKRFGICPKTRTELCSLIFLTK